MLRDITKIAMMGACFDSLAQFDFFNPHEADKLKTVKGALLYGRNGTGKSTIARAFCKLAGATDPRICNATFYDDCGQVVSLNDDEKKRIFVFDEEYVNRNVKFQEDHLETIVMLGHAADLTQRITEAETERDAAKTAFEQQDRVYKQYCDANDIISPSFQLNLLKEALRGDSNWAGRDKKTRKDQRLNSRVQDETYRQFLTIIPSKPKAELLVDFQAKQKELAVARTGVSVIQPKVPSVPTSHSTYDDEMIQKLLAERIEKPQLSEREKGLLILVQQSKANELAQRKTVFQRNETTECPYCFQPLSQEYKESLVESIEKVLSEEVDNHRRALQKYISDPITISLSMFEKLDGYQSCVDLITEINAAIQKCNDSLERKTANPYESIITTPTTVKTLVDQLAAALENLESARKKHNETATKTDHIIAELRRINGEITHYDVAGIAIQYDKQEKECKAAKQARDDLKTAYEAKERLVDDLNAQRKNVRLALDTINSCLKYIFFADDRLKIENVGGTYKLLSHGKRVRPCDVSVGERNIIGLSYFFTSILEGREVPAAYGEEYLLVIDDPVSSYDNENRIGILSFIKYELSMFLEGNQHTKALVMTHDLMTFYDTHKVFEEIINACKEKKYPHEPKFNRFEIRENGMGTFSYNKRQEYSEIIKTIYAYASGQSDDHELIVGNYMRQALEAFATFEYKKGIEAVSTDAKILSLLPKQEYISYYKNLMYRLVLHGGSHKEDQVKSMNDFRFFSLISETEKKRTAKEVLCFIFLLNEQHLLEHLRECQNVKPQLDSWCQEIEARAAII